MTRKSLQVQRLTPRYSDVLRLLVAEALETLGVSQTGERSQIIADPRDRDLLQAILDEIPQEIPVRYDLTGDSGVIAESRDGRIRVINTFESRLEHALPYLQSQWGATLANDGASRAEQA